MAKVFWDTNLFIYLLEDHPALSPPVVQLRSRMRARGDQLYTSALTLGEILIKPQREGRRDLVERYVAMFRPPSINIIPFDLRTAPCYSEIRQKPSIRPADAIQLACAAAAGMDLFVTNDERLSTSVVRGVHFIVSLAHVPI